MSLMHKIFSWPKRRLTSKGYGVHSPFAFAFITKVLTPDHRTGYYSDRRLTPDADRRKRLLPADEARRLLRVLCHLKPAHVVVLGTIDDLTRRVIEEIYGAKIHEPDAEAHPDGTMVVIGRIDWDSFKTVRAAMHHILSECHEASVVIADLRPAPERKLWLNITNATDHGMGFTDLRMGVFVSRRGLPFQIFEIAR